MAARFRVIILEKVSKAPCNSISKAERAALESLVAHPEMQIGDQHRLEPRAA